MKARINPKPNTTQRKALREECVKIFDEMLEYYNKESALQVLHILRFDFGFGQERLERFAKKLYEMQMRTIDRYDVAEAEVHDVCRIQLRDSGIDIEKILNN